jgi:hypothetical protein
LKHEIGSNTGRYIIKDQALGVDELNVIQKILSFQFIHIIASDGLHKEFKAEYWGLKHIENGRKQRNFYRDIVHDGLNALLKKGEILNL